MGAIINLHNISNIYCGGTKIKTVYAGDKVVYKSDAIDPEYNYYVFKYIPNTGMHIVELVEYRAGDETEWDGYTDWGDGTRDKELVHIYEKPGIYTVKTKWMIHRKETYPNHYAVASLHTIQGLIGCDNININITDLCHLFRGCWYLEYVDMSRFDISNITNMDYMFCDCIVLEEIRGIENWDMTNVTSTHDMFRNCKKLKL